MPFGKVLKWDVPRLGSSVICWWHFRINYVTDSVKQPCLQIVLGPQSPWLVRVQCISNMVHRAERWRKKTKKDTANKRRSGTSTVNYINKLFTTQVEEIQARCRKIWSS